MPRRARPPKPRAERRTTQLQSVLVASCAGSAEANWGSATTCRSRRLTDGQHETTSVARARVQLALNIHASLMALLQYNEANGTSSISARARYNLQDGSDAWLVYDDQRSHATGAVLSAADESRALLLKLNHTFLP